jgi:protein phosphatase
MVRASGITDRGRVRPTNEDCFGIDADLQLYVVADGMGGHAAGEVAARLAVETVLEYVANQRVSTTWPHGFDRALSERSNLLRTALQVANTRVYEAAAASPSCAGMGTTLVAALVEHGMLAVAHVGDSRLYTLRRGRLEQLTDDDSWTAVMMARDPAIDPAVLRTHPMRNALTSVIGSRPSVDVHVAERALEADDLLLLTTDGVHGVLGASALVRTCEAADEPQEIAARLVRAALAGGSRDNCTAVVVRCDGDVRT